MENSLLPQDHIKTIMYYVRETKHLEGDTAELGVYRGGISRYIAENNNGAIHHAYDTFTGMPEDDSIQEGHHKGDFTVNDFDYVMGVLNLPNIRIHMGFFPDTAFDTKYKFVHLDADIYQSTKAGLEFFVPRMVAGGIIVLDDLGWHVCPGVRKACDELGLSPTRSGEWQGFLWF
jgi:O-methyltransferase